MNGQSGWNVVAAIAATLIAATLLAMSIPRERINTRKNQCSARMKCLALAAVQHEAGRDFLPGYVQDFGTYPVQDSDPATNSLRESPQHKKLGTWAVALLPWLDAQATYEHWTQDRYPIIVPILVIPFSSTQRVSLQASAFTTLPDPT